MPTKNKSLQYVDPRNWRSMCIHVKYFLHSNVCLRALPTAVKDENLTCAIY